MMKNEKPNNERDDINPPTDDKNGRKTTWCYYRKIHIVVNMCRDTKQTKLRTVNKYYFGKKGKK